MIKCNKGKDCHRFFCRYHRYQSVTFALIYTFVKGLCYGSRLETQWGYIAYRTEWRNYNVKCDQVCLKLGIVCFSCIFALSHKTGLIRHLVKHDKLKVY